MKKSLLAFSLLLLAISSFAQIKEKTEEKSIWTETLAAVAQTEYELSMFKGAGELSINALHIKDSTVFILAMGTTNRYDEKYMVLLGTTPEAAQSTLVDLVDLCSRTIGTEVEFDTIDQAAFLEGLFPETAGKGNLLAGYLFGETDSYHVTVTDAFFAAPVSKKDSKGKAIVFRPSKKKYAGKVAAHRRFLVDLLRDYESAAKLEKATVE